MTGIAEDPGVEAILVGLARDITRLPLGKALTIAEFAVTGVFVWRVRPDSSGTPRVWRWAYDWPSLRAWGDIDEGELLDEGQLLDRLRPEDDARVVLARTGDMVPASPDDTAVRDADHAFAIAASKYPHARRFSTATGVDDLLREATARVPLPPSLWYELVVLRRRESGHLELTVQQLFLPEAKRDDVRSFTVRCEASDPNGTVFAVVARDAAFSFELLSMASAPIRPGIYRVTARLLRPGEVQFDGLPAVLSEDGRNWLDILAVLPDSLDEIGPAHLIVAIEAEGEDDTFRARVNRAEQLIRHVDAGARGRVAYSLVTYATHEHDRWIDDEPVTILAWAQPNADQLDRRLRYLREHVPGQSRYPRAAQIECMLNEIRRRLRDPDTEVAGRPVLVTIGHRTAFPHRVDPSTGILPCPAHRDWRLLYRGLAEDHAGMAFGAIRDTEDDGPPGTRADDIWQRLGADANASLAGFDPHRFAASLGLLSATPQLLPLPLAIIEGI